MPHRVYNIAGVQNALAIPGAAAQVVNAGPNVPQGVIVTDNIAYVTPPPVPTTMVTAVQTAVTSIPSIADDILATVTATPTLFVKRSVNATDLESLRLLEDGQEGFDPEDPNVEYLWDEDVVSSAPAPTATKVGGAFGPGGAPARDTDFNFHKGAVAPDSRHRKQDMKEMKKAKNPPKKSINMSLQQERKAYLAQMAAAEDEARAKAAGAQ